jgi:GNAT superfamily N-acetyltransferase
MDAKLSMSAAPAEVFALRDLDSDPDDTLIDGLYQDVLAVSFSPDELDQADAFAEAVRGEGGTEVLASVAVGRDGAVLGGVVGEVYARERVLLLAYLAVRPELRSRGIGTMLMQHVAPRWFAHPDVLLAVAEVHDPRPWSAVAGEDPLSRLRLYERLGARVLGVPFIQPALGPGRARVPGFLLFAFHVDPSVEVEHEGEGAVRSDLVGRFVRRYYETAEGITAPYDSELAELLRRIEGQATIRLLPVAEYDRVALLTEPPE